MPTTLTLVDPVPCMFIVTAILKAAFANESASDIEDAEQPADTATRNVPAVPALHLLLTLVSDIQTERSLAVLPNSTPSESM